MQAYELLALYIFKVKGHDMLSFLLDAFRCKKTNRLKMFQHIPQIVMI